MQPSPLVDVLLRLFRQSLTFFLIAVRDGSTRLTSLGCVATFTTQLYLARNACDCLEL